MSILNEAKSNMKIGGERFYFKMYRDVEKFKEKNYIFCDEINDYTFVPYNGTLNNALSQKELNESLEEIKIFVFSNNYEKLDKIPCMIDEKNKRVYISEKDFNTYWKLIIKQIYKNLCYLEPSCGVVLLDDINKKVSFDLLENKSRDVLIGKNYTIEYRGKILDIDKQHLASKKANIIADNSIRFIQMKNDGVVHDKTCELFRSSLSKEFSTLDKLPDNCELCPNCKRKILIRNAIKRDQSNFDWYYEYFERGKVGKKMLDGLLYGGDVELYTAEGSGLIIKKDEDSWSVMVDSEGYYRLYHNNYTIINSDERSIGQGFHYQHYKKKHLSPLIGYIINYNWKEHLQAIIAKRNIAELDAEKEIYINIFIDVIYQRIKSLTKI